MKQMFKIKRKKTITVHKIVLILTVILIAVSVGYSKLSSTLTIHGTVTGRNNPVSGYDYVIDEEDSGTR